MRSNEDKQNIGSVPDKHEFIRIIFGALEAEDDDGISNYIDLQLEMSGVKSVEERKEKITHKLGRLLLGGIRSCTNFSSYNNSEQAALFNDIIDYLSDPSRKTREALLDRWKEMELEFLEPAVQENKIEVESIESVDDGEDFEDVEDVKSVEDMEMDDPLELLSQKSKMTHPSIESLKREAIEKCIHGINDLRTGIIKDERKKAASMIYESIADLYAYDIPTLSKMIIDQYKLDRNQSSGQGFHDDDHLKSFIPALIKEVRERIRNREDEDVTHQFIAHVVINFNQGKPSYEELLSGKSQEEEFKSSIESAVEKAKKDQARKNKRVLIGVQDALEAAEAKAQALQESMAKKDRLIMQLKREKTATQISHDKEIEQKDEKLKEKELQLNELKINFRKQKQAIKELHEDEIKRQDRLLKEKDKRIENLEDKIKHLKSAQQAASPSRNVLEEIAALQRQLAAAVSASMVKDQTIEELRQKSVLQSSSKQEEKEKIEGRTTLADELLRVEKERLEKENATLKRQLAESTKEKVVPAPVEKHRNQNKDKENLEHIRKALFEHLSFWQEQQHQISGGMQVINPHNKKKIRVPTGVGRMMILFDPSVNSSGAFAKKPDDPQTESEMIQEIKDIAKERLNAKNFLGKRVQRTQEMTLFYGALMGDNFHQLKSIPESRINRKKNK